MIETAESFLRHMNWQDHQALIVAHEDKHFQHCHLMINATHPVTGLHLDDSFERRRAQAWALDYEREHGRVLCEQRLENVAERDDAPTRPAWMAFKDKQSEFERQEKNRENQAPIIVDEFNNPDEIKSLEWRELKSIQRDERISFFAEGKIEFKEIRQNVYREFREEFRERWADYYSQLKEGADPNELASSKQTLISEQTEALEQRRDEACQALRTSRDERYRTLLDDQRELRHGLSARQEMGFDNALFLDLAKERDSGTRPVNFPDAAFETTAVQRQPEQLEEWALADVPARNSGRMKSAADVGAGMGEDIGFTAISIFDSLADGLMGAGPVAKPRQFEALPPSRDPFDNVIAEAQNRERAERQADEDARRRQRSYGE